MHQNALATDPCPRLTEASQPHTFFTGMPDPCRRHPKVCSHHFMFLIFLSGVSSPSFVSSAVLRFFPLAAVHQKIPLI